MKTELRNISVGSKFSYTRRDDRQVGWVVSQDLFLTTFTYDGVVFFVRSNREQVYAV